MNERPIGEEPTHAITERIADLQAIQKANPPESKQWQDASAALAPLFAEMQKRFPGEIDPTQDDPEDGFWGKPISVYTRAQAIADGYLIDVTEWARVHGFKLHTVMTAAVWRDCVEWNEEDNKRKGTGQDEKGRALDVFAMAAWAMRGKRDSDRANFTVLRTPREGRGAKARAVDLVIHVGPGDTAEAVLTIMFPGED